MGRLEKFNEFKSSKINESGYNSYTLEAMGEWLKKAGIDPSGKIDGHMSWSMRSGGDWTEQNKFLISFKSQEDYDKAKKLLDIEGRSYVEKNHQGTKYPLQLIVTDSNE